MATPLETLLNAAQAATGSDYKTAKALGITPQRLSDWRHGRQTPQPEDHALLAQIAGLDPMEAMARAVLFKHADTPKGERLLSALGKGLQVTGGAAILLISLSAGFLAPSEARAAVRTSITTMYRKVKSLTHRRRGILTAE